MIRLPCAHLRCHERRSARGPPHEVTCAGELRAAEVGYLDVAVRAQQEIVRLKVTVCNLVGVQIAQALPADAADQKLSLYKMYQDAKIIC